MASTFPWLQFPLIEIRAMQETAHEGHLLMRMIPAFNFISERTYKLCTFILTTLNGTKQVACLKFARISFTKAWMEVTWKSKVVVICQAFVSIMRINFQHIMQFPRLSARDFYWLIRLRKTLSLLNYQLIKVLKAFWSGYDSGKVFCSICAKILESCQGTSKLNFVAGTSQIQKWKQ